MAQPWLLITCGLPFSGKSTLARGICDRTGFVRVSVDDLIIQLDHMDGVAVPAESWRDAYLRALRSSEDLLGKGESVVFDSVGHTRKNRYRLYRVADRSNARSLVVHLDVDRTEALARLNANRSAPSRPNVPIDGFDEIANDFEPPDDSDSVLTYSPEIPVLVWTDEILIPYLNGA